MTKEETIYIYQLLETNWIPTWLVGGWGIDALLGEQTRTHKDLDILMLVDDVERLLPLLEREGYRFAYLWDENRYVQNRQGIATATAFVWRDDVGREIDAHVMWMDEQGNGIPAWIVEEGFQYQPMDLAAHGVIAAAEVKCISPHMQLICHTGYVLPEAHQKDIERIRAKFGIKERS
jgi:lincosamide nucleotidyltransferase A/C/D/E